MTSLCDNCSERQLKIKKRQQAITKASISSSDPSKLKYFSQNSNQYSYSPLLHNALFLLQMTSALPEEQVKVNSVPINQKIGFSCLKSFGITETQVANADDSFFELKSPVAMRDFAEAVALKERRSILAASTSFADDEWDPFVNKRRKASNGDQISGK